MKTELLIKQLIDQVIAYQSIDNKDDISLESFINYLQKKYVSVPTKHILNLPEHHVDQEIIVHIGRLYRFAHMYLKTVLADSLFSTDMDFAFTAILQQYGPLSKMELIRKMVYEKSSGMEIIKRLIKNQLVRQTDNPSDKRSKLLELTDKGKNAIFEAYESASPAAKTVSLPLSPVDKQLLFSLLSRLDDFHLKHYLDGESNPLNIISQDS